ncbi:MAG: tetratricopeptide repeat protein, partial [Thermoanaerobacteraceae bacterium]|nr:tetratricopeptide repeat protein [Thermoanaerobacteraceae bacterium]
MNVDAVVRRAYLSLEDGDFSKAAELLDQALNEEPENAAIYVGLLCAELKVHSESELANCRVPIADYNNFKKAVRFGDDALVKRLNEYNNQIVNNLAIEHKKREYSSAMSLLTIISNNPETTHEQCIGKAASLSELARRLRSLDDYEDSMAIAEKCEQKAEELRVLAEQRKQESHAVAEVKKKKKLKRLLVTGVAVALIVIGLFIYIKVNEYVKSLPGKYHGEYQKAFDDGDYIKAQEYYKKYLDVTKKEEGPSGTLDDFIARCNISKISEEGLQAFLDGDFEKGYELFAKKDEERNWRASLYFVPYNVIRKLLPQLIENLNPVQFQIVSYGYYSECELYWLNSNGTVGTIGGNPCVRDWEDIVKIKADDTVAGLKKDGTLIYKYGDNEAQTIDNVIDFDVLGDYVAVVKPDGTVWCNNELYGSDVVNSWTNIKAVRIVHEPLVVQSLYWGPDGNYQKPEIKSTTDSKLPYLVVQTNDGKVLSSGFHERIYPPDEEALVKDVVNSIQNAPSWGTVLDPASRA